MKLIAKTVADGFLYGLQMSTQRGIGIEFSQYRGYEPGDELSRIDWKLFGRTDRYFVREAQREGETSVYIVIDATGSMANKSQQGGWDKLQYALHLAATLAYIAQNQGDNVGILGLGTEQLQFIPAASGERHWQRILTQLHNLKHGNVFPNSNLLKQYLSRLQRPGMVFVISDFYQPSNEINDFVSDIRAHRNEVAAIQLQCSDELSFDYQGPIRFKDLETGEEILANPKSIRDDYFNAMYEHQASLKTGLASSGIDLCTLDIDKPMDEALYHYLKRRRKVG